MYKGFIGAVTIPLMIILAGPVSAQNSGEFYKGKTISLVIGFGGGGTYDFYGRLVARHLGKHLPGKPNVIVQSMPGGGSFTAANYMYSVAPKDGTVIGIVTQTLAIEEKLGTQGVRFEAAKFNWIGRATSINQVTLASPFVKSIDDAKGREVALASTGAGSPSESYPKLLNALAGTKFKLVGPYVSSSEAMLALERGEVEGALTSWSTLKATKGEWLAQKKINILVQYAMARSPELSDIPTGVELVQGVEAKEMMTFALSGEEVGRSFFAPPDVPATQIELLRAAFDAMTKDPEVLNEVARAKAEFVPLSGSKLQDLISSVDRASPSMVSKLKTLLQP